MRIRERVRGLARRALRGRRPRAAILMYHRIAVAERDPWSLCVAPGHFAEHLGVLASRYRVVTLDELVDAARAGRHGGMVALSFDDGYADNLHAALPLLEEARVPATFFLTSGTLGGTREFWWDELERLLLDSAMPQRLELTIDGAVRDFELPAGGAIGGVPPWEAPADSRLGVYYRIWTSLRPLSDEQRASAFAQIREQLELAGEPRSSHRTLTESEAVELANAALATIGAHSVSHAAFSLQSADVQRHEMRASRHALEALIGRPVTAFAYPYGDYGADSPALARDEGFAHACTTESRCVGSRPDVFLLPRIAASDCDGRRFALQLQELLG